MTHFIHTTKQKVHLHQCVSLTKFLEEVDTIIDNRIDIEDMVDQAIKAIGDAMTLMVNCTNNETILGK